MAIIAAAIIGGTALAGSALASSSARSAQASANQQNMELSAEGRAFNSAEALAARQWSHSMSSTAHQREMADLRAAGLNPILTATGGAGASSAGGVAATGAPGRVEALPGRDYGVSSAVRAGAEARQFVMQQKLMEAQIEKTTQEAREAKHSANIADDNDFLSGTRRETEEGFQGFLNRSGKTTDEEGNEIEDRPDDYRSMQFRARLKRELSEGESAAWEAMNSEQRNKLLQQGLLQAVRDYDIGATAEAKARIEKRILDSDLGEALIWAEKIGGPAGGAVGIIKKGIDMFRGR